MLPYISQTWKKALERLIQLGIDAKQRCPIRSIVVDGDREPLQARVEASSLYITEQALKNRAILSGLVARECFKANFPSGVISREFIDGVSNEFARQCLDDSSRAEWTRLWEEECPPIHVTNVLTWDPAKALPALYQLVEESGLETIIQDFLTAIKYGMLLPLEDCLEYFGWRFQRFSARLSQTELRMINYLLQDQKMTLEEIANRVALSSQWVSTRAKELQKKYILRKFETVRFSKIGIRMFHLLIGTGNPEESSWGLLKKSPFVYSMRRVLSGSWQLLATLTIPDNPESIRAVDEFITTVERWKFRTLLTEIVSSGTHYCFDYYSGESGKWHIPWDIERIQVRKIHTDNLWPLFPKIDQPREKVSREFDALDMQILSKVWNRVSSISEIRRQLKVGQERVASKMKSLREEGIIAETWEVHNIGLTESAMLLSHDVEVGRAIAAWTNRLPKSIVSWDLDSRLTLLSSLPEGGSYGLLWALESLPRVVSANLLGPPIHGRWGFPEGLWNESTQRWQFPSERVAEWFESIR